MSLMLIRPTKLRNRHDSMRIVCMIPAMSGAGGAERTMSYLVGHLARRHTVTLLTLDRSSASTFYALPDSLEHVCIDKLGGVGIGRLFRVLSRPLRIRQEVKALAPDVVLSFMDTMNITALVSCLGLGIPVIVSERNDPALHRIGWIKQVLRDRLYPLSRFVVAQTNRVARYFQPSLLPKLRIIANPVPVAPQVAVPDLRNAKGRMRVISVGRFEPHKGFDRLIRAFANTAQEWPDWDLVIIGDGPERAILEALIRHYGLEDRIHLPGLITNVYGELAISHLMAFPSQYEGFPNALAESMAAGLPAIGHRGVSGVEDMIIDGETGLLVDLEGGPAEFSAALSALMGDAQRRRRFGDAARNHILKWAPDHIFGLWDEVILEATSSQSPIHQ
jgi:GalNAc-alpha-(1->4)-GalNAc-alpha-(1->3)-diNAcBac-PP-undecaprenol alpha-1,4-N-acetyl-D-galactosaminyltransferase